MNIFLAEVPSALFAVRFFLACTKKQTAQGFSHAVSDSIFIPCLFFELNLMTLPVQRVVFDIAPIRGLILATPKGVVSQAKCRLLPLKGYYSGFLYSI